MKTEIYENYDAFLGREDKSLNGVTQRFVDANPAWAEERRNKGCWNCYHCSDCSDCSGCSGCYRCSGLIAAAPAENQMLIPVVPNIHTLLKEAVSAPQSLDMSNWHTCDTTHCRAGWVVTLAGEAGKKLERQTSTEFAAMAIYGASSPIRVSPVRFYETNEVAMADILRCAEEEAAK